MSNSTTEVARFKLIFTKFAYTAKKVQNALAVMVHKPSTALSGGQKMRDIEFLTV